MGKQEMDPETVPVEVPSEYEARFSLDREEPVRAALRFIARNARPPAGYLKARSAALAVAWRGFLHGGGTVDLEARIVALSGQRAELQRRLDGAASPLVKAELEQALTSLDANIAADHRLLDASGQAARDNQRTRQIRIQGVRGQLESVMADIRRYEQARFPTPPELQEEAVRLEKELVKAEKTFTAGRPILEAFGKEQGEHERSARKSLAAALCRRGEALAADCLLAVKGIDPDLLERFPGRTPPEAVKAFTTALELAEVARQLDPVGGDVMGAFYTRATPALGEVVAKAAGYTVGRVALRGA
jgi:hypothetical protein